MNCGKKFPVWRSVLVILPLLTACSANKGELWTSEEAGVSFQIPNHPDWGQISGPREEAKLAFQRFDTRAAVAFITFPRNPDENLNEEFIKDWEKDFYKKGRSVKVSGEFFTFKGKSAYKLIDKRTIEEPVVMRTVILWFDGDKVLEIAASKREADPLEDPVIKALIDSMKSLPKSGSKETDPDGSAGKTEPIRTGTDQTSSATNSAR